MPSSSREGKRDADTVNMQTCSNDVCFLEKLLEKYWRAQPGFEPGIPCNLRSNHPKQVSYL